MAGKALPLLRTLALISFYGYVAALFVLGAAGLFAPVRELDAMYEVKLDRAADPEAIVILHQYRFMKGLVLGFGIYCLAFRREILSGTTHSWIFLATLFLGVCGRLASAGLDGRPPTRLISFTFSEVVFGLLIFAYVQTVRRTGPTGN